MEFGNSRYRKSAWAVTAAIVPVFAWFGLVGGFSAEAQDKPRINQSGAKISADQATEIALKKVPGKVTSVSVEKKRGKNVHVIEIIEKGSGAEVDVLVDMETGKVLGTER